MEFPIKFKHLQLDKGKTQVHKVDDQPLDGYTITDSEGTVVASGTSLASLFEYGLSMDGQYELMNQFIFRGNLGEVKHLEGIDCDDTGEQALQGFVTPGMVQGPGSGGLAH